MVRARTSPLTTGSAVEARVAQVWFWEGYFVRSGVDLQNEYGAELIQVTDHDLVATSFSPNLERRRVIGESKSGTGKSAPKPLDRIVWLAGLQKLAVADAAELTIAAVASTRVRELGRHLNVSVQSLSDLEAREAALGMEMLTDSGSQGVSGVTMRQAAQRAAADDSELNAAFRFLTSKVWHIDSFSAAKQLIGLISRLSKRYTPGIQDDDLVALTWLLSESVALFALSLTAMAGEISPMSPPAWVAFVRDRLADGVVPASKMRQLSPGIDKYIAGVLRTVRAPNSVVAQTVGAFEPSPPDYADSLAELALRLKRSGAGQDFARQVDYVVFERMARNRQARSDRASRLGVTSAAPFGALSAFLRQFAQLPESFHIALTTPLGEQPVTRTKPAEVKVAAPATAITDTAASAGEALFDLDASAMPNAGGGDPVE